jgi:hypothetical protein
MAIIGMTDNPPAFPRLGTLRKGEQKSGNRPGRDLNDRFRLDAASELIQAFDAAFPTGNNIEVILPYPSVYMVWDAWLRMYTASALHRVCDGKTCQRHRDSAGVMIDKPRPCLCEVEQLPAAKRCKPAGALMVIIPALQRLGYIRVVTTSIYDIMEIQRNLDALAALAGDLRNIPLIISRTPRMVSVPGDNGQRRRLEKWLISVEPSPEWVQRQLAAMHQHALGTAGAVAMLPDLAPDYDVDEDGVIIEQDTPSPGATYQAPEGPVCLPATITVDGQEYPSGTPLSELSNRVLESLAQKSRTPAITEAVQSILAMRTHSAYKRLHPHNPAAEPDKDTDTTDTAPQGQAE